jgi:hypothetical protein
MTQPELIVSRTASDDIGIRDLYVVIDDQPEQTLLHSQAMRVPLSEGKHTIKITNRLFSKSEEFEVSPGESVTYEVANVRAGLLFAPLVVIGGTGAYKVAMRRL